MSYPTPPNCNSARPSTSKNRRCRPCAAGKAWMFGRNFALNRIHLALVKRKGGLKVRRLIPATSGSYLAELLGLTRGSCYCPATLIFPALRPKARPLAVICISSSFTSASVVRVFSIEFHASSPLVRIQLARRASPVVRTARQAHLMSLRVRIIHSQFLDGPAKTPPAHAQNHLRQPLRNPA